MAISFLVKNYFQVRERHTGFPSAGSLQMLGEREFLSAGSLQMLGNSQGCAKPKPRSAILVSQWVVGTQVPKSAPATCQGAHPEEAEI